MNIAFTDIYGDYYKEDRLFDETQCKIGENLLLPIISLKKDLERKGHTVHTMDMFSSISDIDVFLFQDIPYSILTSLTIREYLKSIGRLILHKDSFYSVVKTTNASQRVLLISEPQVVNPRSYVTKFHQYFGRVATWNTTFLKNGDYYQYYYPQPLPQSISYVDFENKKFCTMICGNKHSSEANELYSERRKFIDYFENHDEGFDLYGIGWESYGLKNYRGKTDHKLETLSQYKFSICYENMCNVGGYITEKIFDCFFAGVVPVYWGATDIQDYIPNNCYIDRREFESEEDVIDYIKNMKRDDYDAYLTAAYSFLHSDMFNDRFSVEAYIRNMENIILNEWSYHNKIGN